MRELILKDKWQKLGAKFGVLANAQCVENFGNALDELAKLRSTVALCDVSFVRKFEYEENDGIDFLDTVLAANILKLRYGKILDTFLADENGNVVAEVFVTDIDDKIIVVAEEISENACASLACENARDITNTHILLSVDGPVAWKVAKEIFGSDILNLSFLSSEKYKFDGESVYLLRNGKTGEYGYQFLAPNSVAEKLADKILESVKSLDGEICGFDTLQAARLEGNFFNVYAEGARVKDPLELGLQWTIDFEKPSFIGSNAIFKKREDGVKKHIVCLKSSTEIKLGDKIFDGSCEVGEVISVAQSATTQVWLATALFSDEYTAAGFAYSTSPNGDELVETISRPAIVAESLLKPMED